MIEIAGDRRFGDQEFVGWTHTGQIPNKSSSKGASAWPSKTAHILPGCQSMRRLGAQLVEGFQDKPCRDKVFFMMGSTTADVDDSAAEKKAVLVSVIARQRLLFSSN